MMKADTKMVFIAFKLKLKRGKWGGISPKRVFAAEISNGPSSREAKK